MNQSRIKVEVKPRGQRKPAGAELGFSWGPLNSALLAAGLALIAAGFFALSKGSTTLAPVLLVGGYVVVIPASLVQVGGKRASGE